MKVLDLRCTNGHGFEGWFASDEDYQSQNGRGLVACPLCGDAVVSRMPSAPRLNLSGARADGGRTSARGADESTAPSEKDAVGERTLATNLHAAFLQAVRHVLAHTEDVGPRFAEEARRIHHGETEARGIRGQASAEEARALADEGIEVAVLPLPPGLDGPLQ